MNVRRLLPVLNRLSHQRRSHAGPELRGPEWGESQARYLASCGPLALRWVAWLAGVLFASIHGSQPGACQAAPPTHWEVMRVFIPDDPDQLDMLVTSYYTPVFIDSLQRELAEESRSRKESVLQSPVLDEAVYVARLDGDSIVSEQSRWKLSGRSSTPFALGTVSVALRSARAITPDKPQLLDYVQFTSAGVIELTLPGDSVERWFGFSANSIPEMGRRRFELRLPAATSGKLLIAAPASVELSSSSVVVERVQALTGQLPDGWNAVTSVAAATGSQWWAANLSGVSTFDLTVEQQSASSLSSYKHLVHTGMVEYSVAEQTLFAHAKFVVANRQEKLPLRVRLGRELHVKDVLVDGLPVPWRVQPSLSSDFNLIELLNLDFGLSETVIEMDLSSAAHTDARVVLPEIAVAESYTFNGQTRVFGIDGMVADALDASGCILQHLPLSRPESSSVPRQPEQLMWQALWTGNAPQMEAGFSRLQQPWVARSLTRFSIQSDWLSAYCRMQIASEQVDSNELRLRVGRNWFVDSVKLVQAGVDLRARLEDREDAENPVIVIGWEGKRNNLSLELDVVAHSPRDTNAEFVSLRSPRLITLSGADQIDNYVIEPSARYGVQLSANLLAYQLQSVDLPDWQQQLLPQTSGKWIFKGVRGAIPPIILAASGGTFSTKIFTVAEVIADELDVTYTLQCQPAAGSIDRLTIVWPDSVVGSAVDWQLVQLEQETDLPIALVQNSQAGAGERGPIELELPAPLNTPFTLRAQLTVQPLADGTFPVPIVSTPAATSGESILIFPKSIAHPLNQNPIELLPPALCCTDSELASVLADVPGKIDAGEPLNLVAARVEPGVSQTIELRELALASTAGWAWSETLHHRIFDNGRREHEVEWVVQGVATGSVEVVLPFDWKIETALINGERQAPGAFEGAKVVFDVTSTHRATLSLFCYSDGPPSRWLSYETQQQPQVSLPVLSRRQWLSIPPTRVPLRLSRLAAPASRLVDRLLPSNWWSWLAPAGPARIPDESIAQRDWFLLEIQTGDASASASAAAAGTRANIPAAAVRPAAGVWIIQRSALSAMSLASVLALGAAYWLWLGASPKRWWLLLSSIAIVVVLVPTPWVPLAQHFLLAAACAALLRLVSVVARARRNASKSPRGGSGVSTQTSLVQAIVLWLVLGLASQSHAQPPNTSAVTSKPDASSEIFGVLIPVDEQGEVSGAYAYVPTRLMELLTGADQAFVRTSPPRVLSADYTLRTRRSNTGEQDQLQELSVEFRIQVSQADAEIRLPFKIEDVFLERGAVGGQDLLIGGPNLHQEPNAIVFRSNTTGVVRLQLELEPRELTLVGSQTVLRCSIPPIPTATLRIVADSTSTFEVRSTGGSQKTVSSAVTELLGPVDLLEVRWSQNVSRSNGGQTPPEVFAETWLHARGSQLTAVCQLRIVNGRSLPRELHLVAESGWEPIGTSWGDGRLIANELSSLLGRRVYTIQCAEDWNQLPQLTLRVVMAPRGAESLTAMTCPFFSLQELRQQAVTRTLGWSAEGETVWRPDGLDFLAEMSVPPGVDWGSLQSTVQPKLYRIPIGSMATSIRRQPLPMENRVDEITLVHLGLSEMRIQYTAQFQQPDKRALAVIIPKSARVDSVLIDGKTPRYRVSERDAQSVLDILPGENPAFYTVVELELSLPQVVGRETPLPRVALQNLAAESSIYRLLRAAGLRCELQSEGGLKLEAVNASPSKLLSNLESVVGQTDLEDQFRADAQLPLSFTLRREASQPEAACVLLLDRSEQGWRAKLVSRWKSGNVPLDFVFIELPVSVRESVDTGQLPARFIPMGDSGRMAVCLIPPPPSNGLTQVEFAFQLTAGASSQSVAVPQVAVLSGKPVHPTLALPRQIDGQPVRWVRAGRKLDDSWQSPVDLANPDDYEYFESEMSQSLVSWKPLDGDQRRTELLATQITLLEREAVQVSGYIDYWIQPGGRMSLPFLLPPQCSVVGVEIGGRPAIWQVEERELLILPQPNHLPINLRLILQWRSDVDGQLLKLPRLKTGESSSAAVTTLLNQLPDLRIDPATVRVSATSTGFELANRWAEVLLDALPLVNGQQPQEIETWLVNWHPRSAGLDGTELVNSQRVQAGLTSMGLNLENNQFLGSVEDFWSLICAQTGIADVNLGGQNTALHAEKRQSSYFEIVAGRGLDGPLQRVALTPETKEMNLLTATTPGDFLSRSAAAGLMGIAAVLVLVLAQRLRGNYATLLSFHPWIYWMQLAGLTWCLLPVAWPSWLLLVTALCMWIGQVMDSRRRNRLARRVG